ncbi:MAG: DUF4266 domain-containing protein [Methylothermaceae bacterium]|nr:DUF4266 domain-containing protein [Methylothermaceae bacterium]
MRIKTKIMPLLFIASGLIGCAQVPPWERGYLAKPQMALDPYPLQNSVREHVHGSREAGGSARSSGGGGCGCY